MLDALKRTGARVQEDAPLHKRAYWRVGGCAEYLVEALSLAVLQELMALTPLVVLGNGSNTLIHDQGISGVVVRLKG